MVAQLNWYSVVVLIGFVQGVFFAFALWTRRKNNLPDRFLALFVLVLAIILLDLFLETSNLMVDFPNLLGVLWPPMFLVGPLLGWYARSLTEEVFTLDRHEFGHFVPMLASIILLLPFISLPTELKRAFMLDTIDQAAYIWRILPLVIFIFGLIGHSGVYVVKALQRIYRYNGRLPEHFSFDEDINLRWLTNLTVTFFVVWVLHLVGQLFPVPAVAATFTVLFEMGLIVNVFAIGFFATRQSPVMLDAVVQPPVAVVDETNPVKYQSSSLSDGQAKHIEQKLLAHMELAQPYRVGKLTLPQLAEQVDVLPNYLSQVINERLGCNFFDFVNQYRIGEAKRQLVEEPTRNILDIALDAGFNSKSAFYKVFKQQCSMTPSQFRQSHSVSVSK